jgi:hypothetical protein
MTAKRMANKRAKRAQKSCLAAIFHALRELPLRYCAVARKQKTGTTVRQNFAEEHVNVERKTAAS